MVCILAVVLWAFVVRLEVARPSGFVQPFSVCVFSLTQNFCLLLQEGCVELAGSHPGPPVSRLQAPQGSNPQWIGSRPRHTGFVEGEAVKRRGTEEEKKEEEKGEEKGRQEEKAVAHGTLG